jgi:hypothetical protein
MRITSQFLLVVLTLVAHTTYGTAQYPDCLIYKGDTLLLYSNPLEGWLDKLPRRPKELKSNSTACWRGYYATWLLENNQLFLLRIRPGCNSEKAVIPLRRWFRPDAQGRVAATWVDGDLTVPLGKVLHYEHMGYGTMHEKDWLLTFRRGRLVDERTYQNRASKLPGEKFLAQLHQAINWASIPKQPSAPCRVFVEFAPDSTGKHCRVFIRKGCGKPYDAVALQAAQLVARRDWGATYRFGRYMPMTWVAPVVFSEENRRKYAQR